MKRLNISLTKPGSITNAIKALEQYKTELNTKTQLFVQMLGDVGINALSLQISNISPFYKGEDLQIELQETDGGFGASLIMSGTQCAFLEFGAGVLFNTSEGGSLHPKGKELGFTIGSYNPSSPNATNPGGWWYKDKWGKTQHTYGTPTFAPLHNSEMEMLRDIQKVAREVFK